MTVGYEETARRFREANIRLLLGALDQGVTNCAALVYMTGLSWGTVHRIAQELEAEGIVTLPDHRTVLLTERGRSHCRDEDSGTWKPRHDLHGGPHNEPPELAK